MSADNLNRHIVDGNVSPYLFVFAARVESDIRRNKRYLAVVGHARSDQSHVWLSYPHLHESIRKFFFEPLRARRFGQVSAKDYHPLVLLPGFHYPMTIAIPCRNHLRFGDISD